MLCISIKLLCNKDYHIKTEFGTYVYDYSGNLGINLMLSFLQYTLCTHMYMQWLLERYFNVLQLEKAYVYSYMKLLDCNIPLNIYTNYLHLIYVAISIHRRNPII